jgi:phage tail tape-measure protein
MAVLITERGDEVASSLGELLVRIGIDASSLRTGMSSAIRDLGRMQSQAERGLGPAMDKIGAGLKIVGTAAAAGFGAAVVASVKGASSLEAYRNTLNVVMKDQKKAGETMAWAVEFANKTPFETDSVVDATVKLTSYGLEAQKVLPAIGDMAGVMNKDLNQAVEAVADAQTGELERLKEFGITKQMIIDQGAQIMKGKELVNSKGQIVDQENFNKALFSLMDSKFKGGMDLQANSLKGLWSTVTGTFSTTLATMAGISATGEIVIGGFFDNLKNGIKGIVDKLIEWQKDGTIKDWSDKAGAALAAFWVIGSKVFDGLIGAAKWVIDNFGLIGPVLAGVLSGFMAFQIATTIINAAKTAMALFNLVMAANPIAIVVLAVAALVTAGILLYQNWEIVKSTAIELWVAIENAFKKGVNGAIEMINALIKKINLIPGVNVPLIARVRLDTSENSTSDGMRMGRNANGTDYWRGGPTWVGERGPEIVNLPRGSQVIPHEESESMAQSQAPQEIFVTMPVILDGRLIAKTTSRIQVNSNQGKARALGVVLA